MARPRTLRAREERPGVGRSQCWCRRWRVGVAVRCCGPPSVFDRPHRRACAQRAHLISIEARAGHARRAQDRRARSARKTCSGFWTRGSALARCGSHGRASRQLRGMEPCDGHERHTSHAKCDVSQQIFVCVRDSQQSTPHAFWNGEQGRRIMCHPLIVAYDCVHCSECV